MEIYPALQSTIDRLIGEFELIPEQRKHLLRELAGFIKSTANDGQKVDLNFICTHNSRRSQIAQLWAQAASGFYAVPDVGCFSGGTEATAFNPGAVQAMRRAGFDIVVQQESANPVYQAFYSASASPVTAFSKRYDASFNPTQGYAAVMTCSQADENCPVVSGAATRIALPYNDPREFDGTLQEAEMYDACVQQIGRELFYAFDLIM